MTSPFCQAGPLSVEHCDLLKILAHTYLQHNSAEKAAVLLRAVYSVSPADTQVRRSLAYAYIRSGRPHEAMFLLDLPMEGNPGCPEVHLLRSQAYTQMGRARDAEDAMRCYVQARLTSSGGGKG